MESILARVRARYHPLWRLRRWAPYRAFQARFDPTVFVPVPQTPFRFAVKMCRDATRVFAPDALEPGVQKAFLEVLDRYRPETFWDVGANVGFYSWLALAKGGVSEVVLFEPDELNASLIRKTILRNGLRRAHLRMAAVSNFDGDVDFLMDVPSGATGCIASVSNLRNVHSLHSHYGMGKVVTVPCVTLDSLIEAGMKSPAFAKIDVEGAEHFVLEGASRLIHHHRPILILETKNHRLLGTLQAMGYKVRKLDETNVLCIHSAQNQTAPAEIES